MNDKKMLLIRYFSSGRYFVNSAIIKSLGKVKESTGGRKHEYYEKD